MPEGGWNGYRPPDRPGEVNASVPRILPKEAEVDWNQAARFLRGRIRKKLSDIPVADLDDLVQEASVRLLRTLRRTEVRNLEALMQDIGLKTANDFLRRKLRWAAITRLPNAANPGGGPSDARAERSAVPYADPVDREVFVVLEFFRKKSPVCRDLALRFYRGFSWAETAREWGRAPGAIRQQWMRCTSAYRRAMEKSADQPGARSENSRSKK